MQIGPYRLANRLILAPMAGVTDRPFRMLCRRYGAALAVSEMVSSNPALRHDKKTLRRSDHAGEPEPRAVQILGNEPHAMAEAARMNVDRGAQIIDINMGCPAKKVCQKAAGSALLRDERLVARILEAVVGAVSVPVTLKIRTGWDPAHRNAVTIAKIAENSGIQSIAVHGRTRACGFSGQAEYLTIRQIKQTVGIPVVANGDIDSPEKAAAVLEFTGADAVMIGRAALGNPWLFRRIDRFLCGNAEPVTPDTEEIRNVVLDHLKGLYTFYGEYLGVRIARKHVGWYLNHLPHPPDFGPLFNSQDGANQQLELIDRLFNA
ncbi:tRNA dihydrouridine synthase DusB [Methylocaldum szegediense]|uniref:tRNA-dihydrouridine synthase B n=1 Tax=Methylocaldum szegediense TaxID=73780 RepID=A0ABM9I342_9GAMM|nr:tRNA dihydrouridine synthase DusB [Methylocaldum szegediense]CAI8852739.1 tRNA-dihydrouridine synthase B [Methylocaldum szegediense]